MGQRLVWTAVVVAAVLSVVEPTIAEDITGAPIEESFAAAKGRLSLTPEQEVKLTPLLRSHSDKTRAIIARFGATPTTDERQAKYQALAMEQQEFRAQLTGVLSADQLMAWDQARAEAMTAAQKERLPN